MFFTPTDTEDDCEVCFCRSAVGTFNVSGVETLLCAHCAAAPQTLDGEVTVPNEPW